MSLEDRIAALEAEVKELRATLAPRPRSPSVPIGDAIARVACTYIHSGRRGDFTMHRHRCVYLLVDHGVVAYVGRSVRGYATRFSDHAEKVHDRVVIADVKISSGVHAETAFQALEAALVEHYRPRLNVAPLTSLSHAASLWPSAGRVVWQRVLEAVR